MVQRDEPRGGAVGTEPKKISRWQAWLVGVGILITLAGAIGWLASRGATPQATPTVSTGSDTAQRRSVVPGGAAGESGASHNSSDESQQTLTEKASPVLMKTGATFLGGIAAGYAARRFVRTAVTTVTVLIVGLIAISYFGWIDLDLSKAEQVYRNNADWLQTQGGKIASALWERVPGTMAGAGGAVVGFMRK